jgi:hypothetical protein
LTLSIGGETRLREEVMKGFVLVTPPNLRTFEKDWHRTLGLLGFLWVREPSSLALVYISVVQGIGVLWCLIPLPHHIMLRSHLNDSQSACMHVVDVLFRPLRPSVVPPGVVRDVSGSE